jgi:hypothetical protein
MVIMVHLAVRGTPLCVLLDVVEVARAHTGLALAEEFTQVLEEFRVAVKVSKLLMTLFSGLPGSRRSFWASV